MARVGKMLLGAVAGVTAIAAAPFTGGGSLLAGATIAEALAGTMAVSTIAAAAGAGAGALVQSAEDNKILKRTKEAKASSFVDGVNAGKAETVNELKIRDDFYLASTALSYFFARCDGHISEEEQLEIDFDLDAIIKNCELPDALKKEMLIISENEELSFDDVKKYLDAITFEQVQALEKDVQEIISASEGITPEEEAAKKIFVQYMKDRGKSS